MLDTESSELTSVEFDPFAGPLLELSLPATESQRELWAATRMGADASCAFNESNSLRLRGQLDVDALRQALADVVRRHEALRSTFSPDGEMVLVAVPDFGPDLTLQDMSALDPAARQSRVDDLLTREVEEPFDVESGPLLRARLLKLSALDHLLVLTAHHIVCDGWSTAVILRDLAGLYSARRRGSPSSLAPAFPFSDYARERREAEQQPEDAEVEGWWLRQFAGPLPSLDLPTDSPRPPLKTYASRRQDTILDAALVEGLRALARRSNTTLFTVLLASFEVLLQRLSGAQDLIVAIPFAGQASSGHQDLVGHCVNTLPIRARFSGDDDFGTVVTRLREAVLDATERSEYTFGRLLRKLAIARDPSRLPLADVMFNLDQGISSEELEFDGLEASFASNPRHFEDFDLFLNAVALDGVIHLECQFNSDLFSDATVRRWLNALAVLLRAAIADPTLAVGRLPVLTEQELGELDRWNTTARPYPRELQAHQLVEAQVAATPDAVSVSCAGVDVTYADLDRRANRLARHLRSLGVESNVPVGVCLERSPEMLVAILAVSKAGGAYLPLDPTFPADRLSFMIKDSGMPILVTQRSVTGQLPELDVRVVSIDEQREAIEACSDAPLAKLQDSCPEDAAYVIYTSGSTGMPKGVVVPHRSLVNLLSCATETPGMAAEDVIVAITTLSFDIATYELWLPLTVGARIVLAPREAAGDGPLLLSLLHDSQATVLQATPATWRLLIQAGWSGGDGLKAISTGEALPRDLAQALVRRSDDVWNMYGPTETTVWSAHYRVPTPVGHVLIGRPMANTRLHILDSHHQVTPIGVPGELYIGGDGVTLGYLNRPELTAERFIADPFATSPGARLYRTGDQARWRPDGTVDYLGRNDYQVKVRGFRIELEEIEVVLAKHHSVAAAVVTAREDRPGDVRLVAYVISNQGTALSEDELGRHLRRQLPEYMIPQHFVCLDSFPLTPNGKIDRKSLPAPQARIDDDARNHVSPRTEREHLVAQVWQDVLGVGRISIHDDFFRLGGHSLLAAQVVSRLARDHGFTVPMRRMFEAPTVAQFAGLMDTSPRATPVRIQPRAAAGAAPASIMQRRIALLEQIGGGRRTFNLPAAWRLRGHLAIPALRRALEAFVERQTATRASLPWVGDEVVQALRESIDVGLNPIDLRGLPASGREAELMRRMLESSDEPFDLAAGPLLRATLYQLQDSEYVLFLLTHHAIWDGWSFDIFVRELNELYEAFSEQREVRLAPLPIQYSDFSAWHNDWLKSDEIAQQVAYWHEQLAGDIAPLELPTDRPRTRGISDEGATEWVEIPGSQAETLASLGRSEGGITLYMVLLAAFETLLHRYSGQADFLVGTPVRGRTQPETEDIVGFFVNTIMIRSRLDGDPTFREVLQRVRATVLDAFSHQDVPFEFLQMTRNPVYRAFFSFQDARTRPTRLGNVAIEQLHVLPAAAANDVSLWIMHNDRGLVGGFNYSTELFDRSTARRFIDSFLALLRAAADNPDARISTLAILTESDRAPIAIGDGNVGSATPLHVAFERNADLRPSAIAVHHEGVELTYAELDGRTNAVAHRLRELGVRPSSRVAVLASSGIERLVGIIAVAKAGAACMLLDPRQPAPWSERVMRDGQPCLLVTGSDVPAPNVEIPTVVLGDLTQTAARAEQAISSDDACLVSWTIASGGHIRFIDLTHATVASAVDAVNRAVALLPSDRFAGLSAPGSGRWALDAWLALSAGATLILADDTVREDDGEVIRALADAHVTAIHADPSTWQRLFDLGLPRHPDLLAVSSGGPLTAELAQMLTASGGRAFNIYGQAETGFWTGINAVLPERPAALGRPLGTGRWYIVDRTLRVLPRGLVGELVVADDSLRIAADCSPDIAEPVVRTGDLVRASSAGEIAFVGRNDERLTIRGLDVEPALITRVLIEHPGVEDAAVTAYTDGVDTRLVAWVVFGPGEDVTESDLRRHVRRYLPEAMLPRRFIELTEIPRGSDGTVTRALLPTTPEQPVFEKIAPRSQAEQLLAGLWQSALEIDQVGIHDNFFDLGGHSLLCLQIVTQVERQTGFRLNPRMLLLNTLEQVAAHLGGGVRASSATH